MRTFKGHLLHRYSRFYVKCLIKINVERQTVCVFFLFVFGSNAVLSLSE